MNCNTFNGGCADPNTVVLPDGDYVLDLLLLDANFVELDRLTDNISLPGTPCAAPLVENASDVSTETASRAPSFDEPATETELEITAPQLDNTADKSVELALFPNPAEDQIFFISEQMTGKMVQVQILNNVGQVVYNEKINNLAEGPQGLNVSQFANGLYYLRLSAEGQEDIVKKFVVGRK